MNSRSLFAGSALCFCLVLAFFYRFHLDNSGDSPWTFFRNDEVHYHSLASDFLQGRYRVEYFINPTLFAYAIWLTSLLVGLWSVLTGRFASFADFRLEVALDPWWLLIIARSLAIAAGVASVAVLYFLGRRLQSSSVGLMAALALALDAVHIERSQIGVNEAPMLLMVLLFFAAASAYIERPTVAKHLLAGALLGLACSLKYNAGIHLFSFFCVSLLGVKASTTRPLWRALCAPRAWIGFGAVPLAFVLGTPALLWQPRAFWRDFRTQSSYLSEGFVRREKQWEVNGWRTYIERFPEDNVGLYFSLLCGLGLLWCLWRAFSKRDSTAIIVLVAVLPLVLFLGSGTFVLTRFLLPAIPFILLAGALALDDLISLGLRGPFWSRRWSRVLAGKEVRSALAFLLAAALLAPQAPATWRSTWLEFVREDRRVNVARILRDNLSPGIAYADLVYPPIYRFFDDHSRLRRYDLGARLKSTAEHERWQRHQLAGVRSTDLSEVVHQSEDLASLRHKLEQQALRSLIVVLPNPAPAKVGAKVDPALAFASRRLAFKKLRPHEPILQRCTYWEELLDYLVSLQPQSLHLTPDRAYLVAILQLR